MEERREGEGKLDEKKKKEKNWKRENKRKEKREKRKEKREKRKEILICSSLFGHSPSNDLEAATYCFMIFVNDCKHKR